MGWGERRGTGRWGVNVGQSARPSKMPLLQTRGSRPLSPALWAPALAALGSGAGQQALTFNISAPSRGEDEGSVGGDTHPRTSKGAALTVPRKWALARWLSWHLCHPSIHHPGKPMGEALLANPASLSLPCQDSSPARSHPGREDRPNSPGGHRQLQQEGREQGLVQSAERKQAPGISGRQASESGRPWARGAGYTRGTRPRGRASLPTHPRQSRQARPGSSGASAGARGSPPCSPVTPGSLALSPRGPSPCCLPEGGQDCYSGVCWGWKGRGCLRSLKWTPGSAHPSWGQTGLAHPGSFFPYTQA